MISNVYPIFLLLSSYILARASNRKVDTSFPKLHYFPRMIPRIKCIPCISIRAIYELQWYIVRCGWKILVSYAGIRMAKHCTSFAVHFGTRYNNNNKKKNNRSIAARKIFLGKRQPMRVLINNFILIKFSTITLIALDTDKFSTADAFSRGLDNRANSIVEL